MDWTAVLTPTLGATGLLALVVILILRGALVPRSTFDTMREDKDKQIEIWRTAHERALQVQDEQRGQVSALVESNKVTTHVVQSLPYAAGLSGRDGHRELAEADDV